MPHVLHEHEVGGKEERRHGGQEVTPEVPTRPGSGTEHHQGDPTDGDERDADQPPGHPLPVAAGGHGHEEDGLECSDGRGVGQRRVVEGREEQGDLEGDGDRRQRHQPNRGPGDAPTAGVEERPVDDRSQEQPPEADLQSRQVEAGDDDVAHRPEADSRRGRRPTPAGPVGCGCIRAGHRGTLGPPPGHRPLGWHMPSAH